MFRNLLILLSFGFISEVGAQAYNTAIGVKVDDDFGVTLQQRLTKKTTIEGIYFGGFRNDQVHANLVLQRHFPVFTRRTNFYLGVGAGSHWIYNSTDQSFAQQQFVVPAVVGLETSLGRLNISCDFMPHFVLEENKPESINNILGISVRYILIKKKPAKKLIDKIEEKLPELDSKGRSKKKKKKGKF